MKSTCSWNYPKKRRKICGVTPLKYRSHLCTHSAHRCFRSFSSLWARFDSAAFLYLRSSSSALNWTGSLVIAVCGGLKIFFSVCYDPRMGVETESFHKLGKSYAYNSFLTSGSTLHKWRLKKKTLRRTKKLEGKKRSTFLGETE